MGLNDELEKIRQAEEWLLTEPPGSRYYNAARDHLISVVEWSEDTALADAALAAIQRWADRIGGHADLRVPLPGMRLRPGMAAALVPGRRRTTVPQLRAADAQGYYRPRRGVQGQRLGEQGRKAWT